MTAEGKHAKGLADYQRKQLFCLKLILASKLASTLTALRNYVV